jgi:hypothetical protein
MTIVWCHVFCRYVYHNDEVENRACDLAHKITLKTSFSKVLEDLEYKEQELALR